MTEFLRFRSMKYLLGEKYQELEKQTIYFASPEELNDPMEGFRDIVWNGDKIVWINLFKHYVFCLHQICCLCRKTGDSIKIDVDSIPISGRWDQLSTSQAKNLFDDIWRRFLKTPNIQEIIEAIVKVNMTRKIRYRELIYYLATIHFVLLEEILKSYIAHGFMSESEMPQLPGELTAAGLLEGIAVSIKRAEKAKTQNELDAEFLADEMSAHSERVRLQYYYQPVTGILGKNYQLATYDFSKVYVEQLERLLWPKWYTACFMKSYHNSSVWGNYGDNHKGACLIFETVETSKSNYLELNQITGKSAKKMPFHKVSYAVKAGKVDFFRSIGKLRGDVLIKLWYTDPERNESECAAHIRPSGNKKDAWRKNYWNNFYRDIPIKTRDWEYEQEHRLILHNRWNEDDEKKDRTLTYNFKSLKGIILGIRTSDEDRLRIMKIIERKCRENNQSDFKFFQAYYSPKSGDIRKYEIEFLFPDHSLPSTHI